MAVRQSGPRTPTAAEWEAREHRTGSDTSKATSASGRNFLRGVLGDAINVLLACAASNLRKWLRELPAFLSLLLHLSFPRTEAHPRTLSSFSGPTSYDSGD